MGGVEGPFTANLTQSEQFGLNSLQNSAFGADGLGAASDDFIRNALAGGQQNPFLDAAISSAVNPILQNAQLQELRDRATFTNAGHSIQASQPFQQERGRQVANTEAAVGDVAARLAFDDATQRRQQQVQAAQLSSQRLADQREAISALSLPRLIEQFGIDKGNEEQARRLGEIERAIALMSTLAQPQLAGRSSSSGASGGILSNSGVSLGGNNTTDGGSNGLGQAIAGIFGGGG